MQLFSFSPVLGRRAAPIVAAVMLAGCSITPGMRNDIDDGRVSVPGLEIVKVTPEVVVAEALASRTARPAAASLAGMQGAADAYVYRIGVGDVLRVVVWERPELNNPSGQAQGDASASGRVVDSDGTIFFPYVGKTQAAGLTAAELRANLTRSLTRLIREPQVDVRVIEFRSQRIYITGEVAKPGMVFLNETASGVLDVIAASGGFTELSNRRHVLLTRDGVVTELNLEKIGRGDVQANVRLQANDQVHVDDVSDDKIFLLGDFVTQKTIVRQRTDISLAEALTAGGGLDKLGANAGAIFVFRRRDAGAPAEPVPAIASGQPAASRSADASGSLLPKVYALDLSRAEGLLLAERFPLQPRDVVYVASTDFSKYNRIINQLLPTISATFQLDRLIND
ncbi:polysaccharide biosynthesis/export family protein [Solimonas sp. SE-A11]|uniref:polysaccharide biosynthesis/export family protein n=1 Tax=Solimonas sp. SE-A11 TaxID=3054954 RepID=UPI00259CCD8C|nr:polysaccharide biosynthesis/export family protein [Solimonas sp. SE-A11]MDM4769746.1 polysaccharide biosynthesis/export family protein [Solimonas sp. SE-A11]